MARTADSKGSRAPSEAGVRNHLHGIVFWAMGFMVIVIVAAIIGIRIYSHAHEGHRPAVTQGTTKPGS